MAKVKIIWRSLRKKMTKKWTIMTIYQVVTFLLALVLVYSVVNYAVTRSYKARKLHLSDSFTVTAHSGSMDTKDNSLESIEKAISIDADVVEFDVRFQSDGTPVMAHDRMGVNKAVKVEDAFKIITEPGVDIKINLDIKETTNLIDLEKLVVRYSLEDRAFMTGVTEDKVSEVKRQCSVLKYYLNYSPAKLKISKESYQNKVLQLLEQTGAIGINCNYIYMSERLAETLHAKGYLLSIWTVNQEDKIARCLVLGADNVTSKVPDRVIDLIDNWGKQLSKN